MYMHKYTVHCMPTIGKQLLSPRLYNIAVLGMVKVGAEPNSIHSQGILSSHRIS